MSTRELILNFHGLGESPEGITDAERKVWIPVAWFEAIPRRPAAGGSAADLDDGNRTDVEHARRRLSGGGATRASSCWPGGSARTGT
jgi:hypothetical protein